MTIRIRRQFAAVLAAMVSALLLTAPASAANCADCEGGNGSGGGGGGANAQVTVAGRFTYKDMTRLEDNTTDLVPIAFAKVEIWRLKPGAMWSMDRAITTDANGSFSTRMLYERAGIKYAARVFATNSAAVVWPEQTVHTEPFWREPGQDSGSSIQPTLSSPTQAVDFTYDFVSRWTAQHYNVAETIRLGRQYVDARRADSDPLRRVNVTISTLTPNNSSFYNAVGEEIVIGIGGNPFEAFNDQIILHEFGHHVLHQISATTLTLANHTGCDDAADAKFAWQEGAASYLARAIKRVNPTSTLRVATPDSRPDCDLGPGNRVEFWVTSALWDIADTENEAFDRLSAMDTEVLHVIDLRLNDSQVEFATISLFRSAWLAHGLNLTMLDMILSGNGIPRA